jgi:hypothetical protein
MPGVAEEFRRARTQALILDPDKRAVGRRRSTSSDDANLSASLAWYRRWYRSADIDEISCAIKGLAQPLIIEWE